MAETHEAHQAWLAQLEADSRTNQELFMNGIAKRLKRKRLTERPDHHFRGAPDFWNAFELSEEERIARFTDNFLEVGGYVERLANMDEVKRFIVAKAKELAAKYILRQNEPELAQLGVEAALPDARVSVWNSDPAEHWKARAAEADIGIVMADYAAAFTGTLAVMSSKDKGRSVSLLPTVLMVILPVKRLKTRLGEILQDFDKVGRENVPAGIHFISGPSRSADIENDLTIGVHGPGIVYTLVVG